MRLIDADKLNRKDVNCANVPMNFIDTAPTVEAIPKDQYEARLKADMVAMLEDLRLEFKHSLEIQTYCRMCDSIDRKDVNKIIQQKINALKAEIVL